MSKFATCVTVYRMVAAWFSGEEKISPLEPLHPYIGDMIDLWKPPPTNRLPCQIVLLYCQMVRTHIQLPKNWVWWPCHASRHSHCNNFHLGLAFVFRQSTVRVQKRLLDVTVSSFECLCGYVLTKSSHFLLLGIYRPGSQAPTAAFFEELC